LIGGHFCTCRLSQLPLIMSSSNKIDHRHIRETKTLKSEDDGGRRAEIDVTDDEIAIVECGTTKGPFVMQLNRKWSPKGYDRATLLFERGYYDNSHFFRVVKGFLVQFGISYTQDEELRKLGTSTFEDDPRLSPKIPFKMSTISYAGSGENSRTSHLFISYTSTSSSLGEQPWETPIGFVKEGMDSVVQELYSYGDMPPWGKGPKQDPIYGGPEYIETNFPLTDRFETCKVRRQKPTTVEQQHERNEKEEQERAGAAAAADDHASKVRHSSNKKHEEGGGGHIGDGEKHFGRAHHRGHRAHQLSQLSVDSKLVIAAVLVVAGIWVCTRPYLKKQKLPHDAKKSKKEGGQYHFLKSRKDTSKAS